MSIKFIMIIGNIKWNEIHFSFHKTLFVFSFANQPSYDVNLPKLNGIEKVIQLIICEDLNSFRITCKKLNFAFHFNFLQE